MANPNSPTGFTCIGRFGGGAPFSESMDKAVGYGTALFINDFVARIADGTIDRTITPGSTRLSGVNCNFGAISTLTHHIVITDPHARYVAQDDDSVTGLLAIDMGANANIVLVAGDTLTGISKDQIDADTVNTTITLDLHLLELYDNPNNAFGPHARVDCTLNTSRYAPDSVGV